MMMVCTVVQNSKMCFFAFSQQSIGEYVSENKFHWSSNPKETISLIENTQTSKSEESCVVLGEELQRRCVCPCCQLDNMEALKGVPQANMEN